MDLQNSHELDDALTAVDQTRRYLRVVLETARDRIKDPQERAVFTRRVTNAIASDCAITRWIMLGTLSEIDNAALKGLVQLEAEQGEWFRISGSELWGVMSTGCESIVFVALRRLADIGLIEKVSGRGNAGTNVRILWDNLGAARPSVGQAAEKVAA